MGGQLEGVVEVGEFGQFIAENQGDEISDTKFLNKKSYTNFVELSISGRMCTQYKLLSPEGLHRHNM